jgi:hypothetical protein
MAGMKRSLCLLSALALAAAPSAAEARQLPGRAEVERAVNAWDACRAGADCRGLPSTHRRLTSSRCYRQGWDPTYPGRILCEFSGFNLTGGRRPVRFHNDCVYLMPIRRGWIVSSVPDADMCED